MKQLTGTDKKANRQSSGKERRKFTRFSPKDGTMAINNHALGPIINISMGGYSFHYMKDTIDAPMTDLFGIFLGSDDILIDKLQSQIIFDKIVSQNTSFLHTKFHQLAIEFLNLSSDQQKELEDFILTKTQGVT